MITLAVAVTRATFLAAASILSSSTRIADLHDASSNVKDAMKPNEFVGGITPSFIFESQEDLLSTAAARFRSKASSVLGSRPELSGPLIRLAFHDATTWEAGAGGPNGSIRYELDWSENRALSKPLALVESWRKEVVEGSTISLSLADAIALGGAVAVEHAGGPHLPIRLGRTDTMTADPYLLKKPMVMSTERSRVTSTMPSAALDSDGIRLYFGKRLGLKEEEIVALSGVHGLGRHVVLLGMSKECLKNLTRDCLEEAPQSLPFVTSSVDRFSNGYFQYLLLWYNRHIEMGDVAFIPTDVALVVDKGFRKVVQQFATDEARFTRSFVLAYQKLVETTATTSKRY